ncbi:hypothetical protein PPL_02719 [Heterostelium album PN500]|uniref:Uncharacterized protein n=1 Tax=Heterostelium pallidum (strain ATCC 26659 / Pp 5 / PN500) TaxID=670386 RepID=D3B2V5_HETP5|nr:hypothetical protein PPL_02719 [Heterostelium album PN500]EFA83653.1 hypothetical protein PPL_02719 [Heterostelium album PN500]|eukprot:XP_020435770.1 hypothetical protein PPL_02719 [Heterostelium album PN500]
MKEQPVYNRYRGGGTNIISNIFGGGVVDGAVGTAGNQQQYYSNGNDIGSGGGGGGYGNGNGGVGGSKGSPSSAFMYSSSSLLSSSSSSTSAAASLFSSSTSRFTSYIYQSKLYRTIYPFIAIVGNGIGQINQRIGGRGRLALFLQVLALALLLSHTLDKFQMTDDADARLVTLRNNLCSQHLQQQADFYHQPAFAGDIPANIDTSILCRSTPTQFSKFVWIFVDSLARDQATDLIEAFQESASVYRIMNHGFKFSTAIYTSFFTGKIPTNYAGRVIKSDNIFYQMKRANFQIRMYFDEYSIIPDEHNILYNLFGDQRMPASETTVSLALDELTDSGRKSIMLTSNLLDDKIHKKGKYDPPTLKLLSDLNRNIPLLKKWLADHPEYLLIVNSDHGGSKTGGQHEGELHGKKDGGNEGFIMFANQHIRPADKRQNQNGPQWLDTVDVAPTLVRYLKNVGIPLESLGKAAVPLLEQPSYRTQYLDLLTNAIQIRQLCKLKGFPYSESEFERASSVGTDIENVDDSILREQISILNRFIVSIKEPMVDFKKFPSRYLLVIGILMISLQILNLKYESNLFGQLRSYTVPIVLIFFFLYIDFLFLKFDYHKHFQNIFNFYLMLSSFSILFTVNSFIRDFKLKSNSPQLQSQQQLQQQPLQVELQPIQTMNILQPNDISLDNNNNFNINNNSNIIDNNNNNNNNNNVNNNNNDMISIDTGFSEIDIQLVQQQQQQLQQQQNGLNNNNNNNIIDPLSNFTMIDDSQSSDSIILDSLSELSNNVCYVMFALLISNMLGEYLEMVYEPFVPALPLLNVVLPITLLYLLFKKRMQQNSTTKVVFMSGGGYSAVIVLSMLYELTGIVSLMQLGYIVLFLQFIQLMMFNRLAEDGYLISSILYYVVATEQQRFYLLALFVPSLYLLSNHIFNLYPSVSRSGQISMINATRQLSRLTAFLLLAIAFHSYLLMGGTFNMNVDVRAGNIGLVNMEDYPTFSGFLMLYHKLGFFFILVTFLARLSRGEQSCSEHWNHNNNSSNNNNNNNNNKLLSNEDTSFKYWIFRYLGQKAVIMMWIFNLNFWQYKDYLDCFIMTMIISIVVILYGVLILLDDYCKTLQPKIGHYIIRMKQSLSRR